MEIIILLIILFQEKIIDLLERILHKADNLIKQVLILHPIVIIIINRNMKILLGQIKKCRYGG